MVLRLGRRIRRVAVFKQQLAVLLLEELFGGERTLHTGRVVQLEVRPPDPSDAFAAVPRRPGRGAHNGQARHRPGPAHQRLRPAPLPPPILLVTGKLIGTIRGLAQQPIEQCALAAGGCECERVSLMEGGGLVTLRDESDVRNVGGGRKGSRLFDRHRETKNIPFYRTKAFKNQGKSKSHT
jgi:hypothetical protein